MSGKVALLPGERLESLDRGDLAIIQRADGFRFGTDSVLLADFAAPRPGEHVVDLGTGSGILPILLAARVDHTTFAAIELQPDLADMARRSVAYNGLQERIAVYEGDLRRATDLLGRECATLVVCNPPYHAAGSPPSARAGENLARREGDCSIGDVCRAAAGLLRQGGRAAFVYAAPRLTDLLEALRRSRLEPKRLLTVHSRADRAPKLVLLDAVKDGGRQLHWLPLLVLYGSDGAPTAEWRRIYGKD